DPARHRPPALRLRCPRARGGLRGWRGVRRGRRQDRRRPVPPERHPAGCPVRRRLRGIHRAGGARPDRHRGSLGRRRHGDRPDGHGRQRGGPPGARGRRDRPLLGVHRHRLARPPLRDPLHTGSASAVRGRTGAGPKGERHRVAPTCPRQRHLRHSREREDPAGPRGREHLGPRASRGGAPGGGDPLLQQRRRLPLALRRPAWHGAGLRLPVPRREPDRGLRQRRLRGRGRGRDLQLRRRLHHQRFYPGPRPPAPGGRQGLLRRLQPVPQHKKDHPGPVSAAGEGLHPHLQRTRHQDAARTQLRRGRRGRIARDGRSAVAPEQRVYRV
ncbi:MAG: hypothetical protein AVDCRST_MAG05-3970, partial [uncultured Rubrobacteraceae bacterium]